MATYKKLYNKRTENQARSMSQAHMSTVAVLYEQMQFDIKNKETTILAEIDKITATRDGSDAKAKSKEGGMGAAVSGTEAIRTWREHFDGIEALCNKHTTSVSNGLAEETAKLRHKEVGDNALTKKDVKPWYLIFLGEMTGFFQLLLWFASLLCFISYGVQPDKTDKSNLYLAIVLAAVVWLTGCFSYAQTSKSAEIMAQFENFIPAKAFVVRGGREVEIDAKLLVPGDVVKIKGGENIPCDVVLFKANEMKVNNASLTGESEDIHIDLAAKPVENIFESKNVGFFGTQCTAGQGEGICFKTGDNTVIGQIANLASSADAGETPLQHEIERFIKIISFFAITTGVLFFILGVIFKYEMLSNVIFAIGIIVANVPEGLVATVTVCLALTAQRMAVKKVLVKNLQSVETLGSTSCICSDKTGTLTQNRMTVSHIFYNRRIVDASVNYQAYERNLQKEKPDANLRIGYNVKDENFIELVKSVTLSTYTIFTYYPSEDECKILHSRMLQVPVAKFEGVELPAEIMQDCRARLVAAERNMQLIHRHCKGDASETGLVQFAQGIMDLDEVRGKTPTYVYQKDGKDVECLVPFSSDIKFNLFIRDMNPAVREPERLDDGLCVYIKGAPERILNRCSKILINGEEVDFDDELRAEVDEANYEFGSLGERVLAFARYRLPLDKYVKGQYEFDIKTWKQWGLNPR